MDYLNILSWLGVGGIGAVSLGLYFLGGAVVMSTLNSVLQLLAPVTSGAKDFVSWYLSNLWDGVKVVMANTSTFLVIATIAAGTAWTAAHQVRTIEVERCTAKIQKVQCQPKLKKKAAKEAKPDLTTKQEWYDPFGIL